MVRGALNNDTAKAILKEKGTELRIRAPGQRATTIEARSCILRGIVHLVEESLNNRDIPVNFTRLLAEALFVCNAFTFYNGVSHYNALLGRQPACLPDLNVLDHETTNETSDRSREQQIRQVSLDAITQATAVAKANRALKATARQAGQRHYKPSELGDYRRPANTKDDCGGWNGPVPVLRIVPDRGHALVRVGNREIFVQCPDVRHALYVDALVVRELGSDTQLCEW